MSYTFKPFEELEFSDDFIFNKVMRNPDICATLIEQLLSIKVDHIEYPELQKTISPYYTSRGIRFDVYLKDSSRIFDIEMQTSIPIDLGKRMRYYQSMIDIDDLLKGADYSELKESYIIFICKSAPFKNFDLPVYTFTNTCKENPIVQLDDKTVKVVYNAKAYKREKNKSISDFLNFVCSGSAESSFTRTLSALVTQAKCAEANKTEYISMNAKEMDIRRNAKKEGAEEAKIETARNLINSNAGSLEQIAVWVNLPIEIILKIQKESI